jgi:transposase-like protein
MELVLEQGRSGQSVSAYCREHGLRLWQFYEWKKRLRDSDAPKFVEVAVKPPAEIAQQRSRQGSAIEVRLRSGHSVVVERGFDASHLRALLLVLESEA